MTSVFNTLLIKLHSRLHAALPDSAAVPGIRMVDQDMGQLEYYTQRPAVSFPVVLVDFSSTAYEQKQFKTQWAQLNIVLRLAFDPWSNSSSITPEAVREKALFYYEIENKIYLALQDWVADGLLMNPMKRITATTEKRDDPFRVRQIVFKATYQDVGMQNEAAVIPPVNPASFRIDWLAAVAGQTSYQDNRLKGKTPAHIEQVSWEGDDGFEIISSGTPTAGQVLLDAAAGTLTFLNGATIGDHVFANVLAN